MNDNGEHLVHTDDLPMQSALGFYSNGSFSSSEKAQNDAFAERVKSTPTGKLLERAGMLNGICGSSGSGGSPPDNINGPWKKTNDP